MGTSVAAEAMNKCRPHGWRYECHLDIEDEKNAVLDWINPELERNGPPCSSEGSMSES
jgi:hypothetical protein